MEMASSRLTAAIRPAVSARPRQWLLPSGTHHDTCRHQDCKLSQGSGSRALATMMLPTGQSTLPHWDHKPCEAAVIVGAGGHHTGHASSAAGMHEGRALTVRGGSPGWMAPTMRMPWRASRPPAHTAAMLALATVIGPSGLAQASCLFWRHATFPSQPNMHRCCSVGVLITSWSVCHTPL